MAQRDGRPWPARRRVAVIAGFVAAVTAAVFVVPGGAGAYLEIGPPVQLTTSTDLDVGPRVSGSRVIWTRYVRGTSTRTFIIDLSSGMAERELGYGAAAAISGNRAVRIAGNATCGCWGTLVVTDLDSGLDTVIDLAQPIKSADISGDTLVWGQLQFGTYDQQRIFALDLGGGEIRQLAEGVTDWANPRVSGDRVVWHNMIGNSSRVYLYDLASDLVSEISPGASASVPAISGDLVVFSRGWGGSGDIIVHDLATGVETPLTANRAGFVGPDISGYTVVWSECCDPSSTAVFDLASGTVVPYEAGGGAETRISGNRLVWHGHSGVNADIFTAQITSTAVPAIGVIANQVDRFVTLQRIRAGTAEALHALLDQAAAALARSNPRAARAILGGFIRLVTGQAGGAIDGEAATLLVDMAQATASSL
jgi:beta propeller repeat protein